MLGSAVFRTGIAPGGALAGPWVRDPLWTRARAVPSLDLRFADNKSLVDAVTGAQLVTHTRASSGTFVGSDGVLRSAVTNLLTFSEQFDNAAWSNNNSSEQADASVAPNGTTTADKSIENSTTNVHGFARGGGSESLVTGLAYAFSVYAKAAERSFVYLQATSNFAKTYFNLSTGTVSATGSGHTASIVAVGNGWYRCAITFTSDTTNNSIRAIGMAAASGTESYLGDGTSGLFLWGAQLEQSAAVGEYIPTTSAINSAPRFDHNPTTGESLGLLVEEARTNSIANSTGVGAVAGTPGTLPTNWLWNTSGGASTQVVGSGTEDGIPYVDIRLFGTTAFGASLQFCANTAIAAAQNQTWTESFYCKLISGSISSFASTRLMERSSAGTYLTEGNAPFTPGASSTSLTRSRFTFTRTLVNASTAYVGPAILFDYIGTVDFTLRIGLPQLEQGAFATSPILTSSATATRAADVASITGAAFTSFYNQTEGTVFAEANSPTGGTDVTFDDGTVNTNRVVLYYQAVTDPRLFVASAGATSCIISAGTITSNSRARLVGAYKLNDFAASVNGASPALDASGDAPTGVDRARIGRSSADGGYLNGCLRRLTYWPTRLSNEVLQRITQP